MEEISPHLIYVTMNSGLLFQSMDYNPILPFFVIVTQIISDLIGAPLSWLLCPFNTFEVVPI